MQKKTTAAIPPHTYIGGKGEKVRQELTRRMATCVLCKRDVESSRKPAFEGGPLETFFNVTSEGRTIMPTGNCGLR